MGSGAHGSVGGTVSGSIEVARFLAQVRNCSVSGSGVLLRDGGAVGAQAVRFMPRIGLRAQVSSAVVLDEALAGLSHECVPLPFAFFLCALSRFCGAFGGDALADGVPFGEDDPHRDLLKEIRQALLERPGLAVAPTRLAAVEAAAGRHIDGELELAGRVLVVGACGDGPLAEEGRVVAVAPDIFLPRAAPVHATFLDRDSHLDTWRLDPDTGGVGIRLPAASLRLGGESVDDSAGAAELRR